MDLNKVTKYLEKRSKWSYLGIAVALFVSHKVYRFLHVPPSLRHIPAVSYWRMVGSFLSKEPPQRRMERLILPTIQGTDGIYLNKIPLDWTVFLANPTSVRSLFFDNKDLPKDQSGLYYLGETSPVIRFVGYDNIVFSNGQTWKRQRKLMNPVFNRAMPVNVFGNLMLKVIHKIENEYQGNNVRVVDLMQRMTLDALGLGVFGFDFLSLEEENSIWRETYENVIASVRDPITNVFPQIDSIRAWFFPSRRARLEGTAKLNNLLLNMAQERRRFLTEQKATGQEDTKSDSEKDLLTLMLEAEIRGEGNLSDEELRTNMAMMFAAGHETTSHALAFAIYYLAVNKNIQDKARQEALEVLGNDPEDVLPSLHDCGRFVYIDMIIKENLRISPTGEFILPRKAVEDMYVGNTFIPKGTKVSIDIHTLQNNPEIWENPNEFRPERFAKDGEHDKHEGIPWVPFSDGTRKCIGVKFSMVEQYVCLAMLLRKYEWELPEESIHRNGIVHEIGANAAPTSLTINFTKRY
ncbi:cytochrome P450 [Radiomyces spectabilis]|uniref:cytochrome P450 n=1 Tax=Radiomyces spectabilis TaxID=64574 RepID=UPI00221EC427|nr:cytochrome P450 [Radiomyces spectabilis]KAI8391099.1 cytochrome P450 [Radiomyces spectabilis]